MQYGDTSARLYLRVARYAALVFLFSLEFTSTCSQSVSERAIFDSLLIQGTEKMYSDYSASDSLFSQSEEILFKMGVKKHPLLWIDLNNQRAFAGLYNRKFSDTKSYLLKSLSALDEFRIQLGEKADSLWFSALFIEALYLSDLREYDLALERLIAIENYFKQQLQTQAICRELYRVLQYQADIYNKKGEYESAVNGYLASNRYYDCYRDPRLCPNYALTYRNVGEAYLQKGDYKNALAYFWKARKNLDSCMVIDEDRRMRTYALTLYHALGQYYIETKDLDSAAFYFQKALPLLKDNTVFTYRIYKGLALIEFEHGNLEHALDLFHRTLAILRAYYGEKHAMTADIYVNISRIFSSRGDYKTSLLYLQKALSSLSGKLDIGSSPDENPLLENIFSRRDMVKVLHQKAVTLLAYYRQVQTDSLLYYGYRANRLALQLLDSSRNDFSLEKDKVIIGEKAVGIYETSIQIALELFNKTGDDRYLNHCFEYIDKSKGVVLLDHLKLASSLQGIPKEIAERELQLKAELAAAEENIFEAESRGADASKERETLGDLKKAYSALFAQIKYSYPEYYKIRIENKAISLLHVQSEVLSPSQALIDYFVGDSECYIFCVTPNFKSLYRVPAEPLRNDVIRLKDLTMTPSASDLQIDQLSISLYEQLISPWIGQIDTTITSLVVAPHDVLCYLPLEMLSNDGETLILDRFVVSYAASASLLAQQTEIEGRGSGFAGFNANYNVTANLPALTGSTQELQSIEGTLGNSSTLFMNSTADDFRQHAPAFKVLHLALHSFINDEKPLFSKLVFSSDDSGKTTEITANELYAMQLNAELAVLSACESGIGKLHKGEGMMSLSRAFMYAGVPSTVISLWKVPDHATARLMEKFYLFLKEGQAKDEALANAKRSFIREYPEMSAPYFWAGFVVNGKSDPLKFSAFDSAQWSQMSIPVLFVALIVTVFVQWRRHQTKKVSFQTFIDQR